MSPTGTYSFLPWLRHGIANKVSAADFDTGVDERASVDVTLRITADRVSGSGQDTRDVPRGIDLYGPGDVVGIDPRAIVRTEPRQWITNFEPNFLPFVEFYDEDLPWRYTPTAPHGPRERLRPWIALVVLAEDEFEEPGQAPGAPLPSIVVDDLALLPTAGELWAWSHVHFDRSLASAAGETASDDMDAVLPRVAEVLAQNPDLACSRLICPRRLAENQAYHAFVVPTFETGRLAGIDEDPGDAPHATQSAWATYQGRPDGSRMPYYHRWFFRTGTIGDFEYLVRLLKPRAADARVGRRDMDMLRPGSNLPRITDPALRGVLRLGGALRVPEINLDAAATTEANTYEQWDTPYPHPFQVAMASLVNLGDDYAADGTTDPDPLVAPPLYGRWHALTSRVLTERDGSPAQHRDKWLHELNLDPRFRVPAGFGTHVVQERQEELMAAAWEQVGDILEANRRIRLAQVAREVARRWHLRAIDRQVELTPGRVVALTAPLHARTLADGVTVAHRLATSAMATAPVSAPMRRIARPRSRLMRSLPFTPESPPDAMLEKIASCQVTAAPPKTAPPGVSTAGDVADELRPPGIPRPILDALVRAPWLRWLLLLLAAVVLLIGLLAGGVVLVVCIVVAVALILLWWLTGRWRAAAVAANAVDEDSGPEVVDALPKSPNFHVSEPGSGFQPKPGTSDSEEGKRFKRGLRDLLITLDGSKRAAARPPRPCFDLPPLAVDLGEGIHPDLTVPRATLNGIDLPGRLAEPVLERFVEAMAYPEFDIPMYRPLVDISTELFLPNLNLVEPNSITLLETNQRFIEAYMVGLNHEFGRELLWREYPTDQRGSYFRQFWDPSAQLSRPGETPKQRRERLRDIPPIHRWPRASVLGDHDHREEGGPAEEEVVLVIRGELLKKYPTAVVYAHRADWTRRPDGTIDPTAERTLAALTPEQEANPPREIVRTPLYEARVDPDISFFGIDLTAVAARGADDPPGDPGWFFVIRERPGEPRFGLDLESAGPLNVWNDLAWDHVAPAGSRFIPVGSSIPARTLTEPSTGEDGGAKHLQWQEDRALAWRNDMTAADVAYILYQAPVLVAVHAREMLAR